MFGDVILWCAFLARLFMCVYDVQIMCVCT